MRRSNAPVWTWFIGLGKVALQSMYFHMEGGE